MNQLGFCVSGRSHTHGGSVLLATQVSYWSIYRFTFHSGCLDHHQPQVSLGVLGSAS